MVCGWAGLCVCAGVLQECERSFGAVRRRQEAGAEALSERMRLETNGDAEVHVSCMRVLCVMWRVVCGVWMGLLVCVCGRAAGVRLVHCARGRLEHAVATTATSAAAPGKYSASVGAVSMLLPWCVACFVTQARIPLP